MALLPIRRKSSPDTGFWWEIRAALRHEGCPSCRVALEAESRFFHWFFIETYYTFPMIDSLDDGGFCRLHARRLVEMPHPYALSATYKVLLDAYRVRLEKSLGATQRSLRQEGAGPGGRALRALAGNLFGGQGRNHPAPNLAQRNDPCPACRAMAESATFAARTLKEDYRFAHEPRGREQRALCLAMSLLGGHLVGNDGPKG